MVDGCIAIAKNVTIIFAEIVKFTPYNYFYTFTPNPLDEIMATSLIYFHEYFSTIFIRSSDNSVFFQRQIMLVEKMFSQSAIFYSQYKNIFNFGILQLTILARFC